MTRIQQMSRDMKNMFHSDSGPKEDQEHRDCGKIVSDSILWQVSGNVLDKWKALGRALDVEEVDLMCIEYSTNGLQDHAYRTLCRWRENQDGHVTYGELYSALCDPNVNLSLIANRYCTLDGVGIA